jgi:hypothetical protein
LERKTVTTNRHFGNASTDFRTTRGWILGHFIDHADGIRHTKDVEVKWGIHPAGDRRAEWTTGEHRTTLLLLVQGRFQIDLSDDSRVLSDRGDYILWGPGIDHSWEALADSIVVTIRWPSA